MQLDIGLNTSHSRFGMEVDTELPLKQLWSWTINRQDLQPSKTVFLLLRSSKNYTVVKVDAATPKRWRFVRGYDKPILMGVASHLLSRWYTNHVILTWLIQLVYLMYPRNSLNCSTKQPQFLPGDIDDQRVILQYLHSNWAKTKMFQMDFQGMRFFSQIFGCPFSPFKFCLM